MEVTTKTNFVKLRPLILILCMLIAASFAAMSMTEGVTVIGLILLTAMGGFFTTLLLIVSKTIYIVIPVIVSVFVLQIAGNFPASLTGLVALIAAFSLSYCVSRRKPKLTALFSVSLILGGGFLLIAAILYVMRGGSLSPSALLKKYQETFDLLKIQSSVPIHDMINGMSEEMLMLYERAGITKEMLLNVYLENMELVIDALQLSMPGICLFGIQFVAYAEISAFRLSARLCRVNALLPSLHWSIYPSQTSCIVYLIVAVLYMVSTFFSSGESVFPILSSNMWLTLLPMMLFCGTNVLTMRLRNPRFRTGTCVILAAFVLGFFFLRSVAVQLALFSLSFLGAQTAWTQRVLEAEKQKNNNQ